MYVTIKQDARLLSQMQKTDGNERSKRTNDQERARYDLWQLHVVWNKNEQIRRVPEENIRIPSKMFIAIIFLSIQLREPWTFSAKQQF